jgi:hypothetical protein
MPSSNYEVIVGNIGTVYSGSNYEEAEEEYKDYLDASQSPYGKASGEEVTFLKDNEIVEIN